MVAVHLSYSLFPAPSPHQSTNANMYTPLLPTPPIWAGPQHTNWEPTTKLLDQMIKELVMNKQLPTVITYTEATSNYGVPSLVSTCETYTIQSDPFLATGQQYDRIFHTSCGQLNPADDLKMLQFNICSPANKVHMVPGFKEHLTTTSKFIDAGYAWLFVQDEVRMYDMANTKITTSGAVILKGWRLPDKYIWQIPLLPQHNETQTNIDGTTTTINISPQQLLQANPSQIPEHINSMYNLKTKPRTDTLLPLYRRLPNQSQPV